MQTKTDTIRPGTRVQVRPEVFQPFFEWGNVRPTSVGVVESITPDGIAFVDFPELEQADWKGLLSELELCEAHSEKLEQKRLALLMGSNNADLQSMSRWLKANAFDALRLPRLEHMPSYMDILRDQAQQDSVLFFFWSGQLDQLKVEATSRTLQSMLNQDASWTAGDLLVVVIVQGVDTAALP